MEKFMVDLGSGLGGGSEAFIRHGWRVIRIDNDPKFKDVPHTIICDIRDVEKIIALCRGATFIFSGPNCRCFSMSAISDHWEKVSYKNCKKHRGHEFADSIHIGEYRLPRDQAAIDDLNIVYCILHIIQRVQPIYWVIENPKATLHCFIGEPIGFITNCQYGEKRQKATNLFGVLPDTFEFKNCKRGADCHEEARRGAKTGTQGIKTPELRAKIPYQLSEALCIAIERALPNLAASSDPPTNKVSARDESEVESPEALRGEAVGNVMVNGCAKAGAYEKDVV